MRCSSDLRQRVVDFVRSGGSKAEAARRFKVGEASVYRWRKPGGVAYKRPGPRRPHKLEWEALRRHLEGHPDRTQAERARHFQVSRHCIWHALQRLRVTHKERIGYQECDPWQRSRFIVMNVGLLHRRRDGMDMRRRANVSMAWVPGIDGPVPRCSPRA